MNDLPALADRADAVGNITSAVQVGFIIGTLVFSILTIADRFRPSWVFFFAALAAAGCNLGTLWVGDNYSAVLLLRFLTGFLLAGIYPIGIKIAADWYETGLGKALGFLLGALVLGTAFPHLLRGASWHFSWQHVVIFTSAFAFAGGLLIVFLVPDGPYKKQGSSFHFATLKEVFRAADLKATAFGYFGHMWELYTFWAFLPVMIAYNADQHHYTFPNVSLRTFFIIGIGGISCMVGGYLAQKIGSAKVAFYALLCSGFCALTSPFFITLPPWIFFGFLLVWGIAVTPDSPQFSTLTALTAPPAIKGTAVTAVICIGFAISIASIQLFNYLMSLFPHQPGFLSMLAIGPLLGLVAFFRMLKRSA